MKHLKPLQNNVKLIKIYILIYLMICTVPGELIQVRWWQLSEMFDEVSDEMSDLSDVDIPAATDYSSLYSGRAFYTADIIVECQYTIQG